MGLALAALLNFRAERSMSVVGPRPGRPVNREESLDDAMDRYAQGEEAAFPALYTGLQLKLRPFLIRLTGAPSVADDLLQETFMRIHRARGSFEPGAAVVPWAYAIARNAWLDHMRSVKARGGATADVVPDSSPPEPVAGPEADAEQLVIARETASIVEAVLARLPAAQREAFVLLRYEGLSVGEAAEILGSTASAVKLRAFRAYQALRESLDKKRPPRGGTDG